MRIGLDATNGYSPDLWTPEAPATAFSTFASAWRGLQQADPPHDFPLRPCPVATPDEFTQIMASVRAAHAARASLSDGASRPATAQPIMRPGRIPTPPEVHNIVARLRERRAVQTSVRDVALFATPSAHPLIPAPVSSHVAFSTALVSAQAQPDRVTMHEVPSGTTAQDVTRRPRRGKVTRALLLRIAALGERGILAKGGLSAIARENDVALNTLKVYVSYRGELLPEGQHVVAGNGRARAGKVTIGLLKELEKLGPKGMQLRGGRQAIARGAGVSFHTLKRLVSEKGKLTALGRTKLEERDPTRRTAKGIVTAEVLRSIQRLGPIGIRAAGGLVVLAAQHNVRLGSLRCHINDQAKLGPKGLQLMNGERCVRIPSISIDLLRRIEALGPTGIKAAGGLGPLAVANNVSIDALRSYIDSRAQLTPAGRARLYGANQSHTARVTATLLQEIVALGREGIALEGGLDAFADKRRVALHSLRVYVTLVGTLKRPGRDMVARFASRNANVSLSRT